MACAASTRPRSTSRRAVSTSRATKGAAAIVSGTMAAAVPIDVPTKKRVSGIMATSKIMNGVERTAFTSMPTVRFRLSAGSTPLRSVRCSKMPSGTPTSAPTTPDTPTISKVSRNDLMNRSIICCDMIQLLYRYAARTHEGVRIFYFVLIAGGQDRQRAEGLPLDLVYLAMQDIEVHAKLAHDFGKQGFFHL